MLRLFPWRRVAPSKFVILSLRCSGQLDSFISPRILTISQRALSVARDAQLFNERHSALLMEGSRRHERPYVWTKEILAEFHVFEDKATINCKTTIKNFGKTPAWITRMEVNPSQPAMHPPAVRAPLAPEERTNVFMMGAEQEEPSALTEIALSGPDVDSVINKQTFVYLVVYVEYMDIFGGIGCNVHGCR